MQTREEKRREFENAEWLMNFSDGLPYNPFADPHCIKCAGFGVLDDGVQMNLEPGTVMVNCDYCWS